MTQIFCTNGHANEGFNDYCTTCGAAIPREGDAPGAPTGDDEPTTRGVVVAPSLPMAPPAPGPRSPKGRGRLLAAVAAAVVLVATTAGVVLALGSSKPARTTTTGSSAPSVSQPPATATPPPTGATNPTSAAQPDPALNSGPSFPLLTGATVEAGPSASSGPFGPPPATSVRPGQEVQIECAAYGDTESAAGVTSDVWDSTSVGWIADVFVDTGTTSPGGESCRGSVSNPTSSGTPLSTTEGPFPLMGDGATVEVFAGASLDDGTVGSVPEGTFVTLVCSEDTGVTVAAPARIAGAGSNSQWDEVSAPLSGWVPDSWVDSDSNGSVAPACNN